MDPGDTFRRQTGEHLKVVISDPNLDPDKVVIVSISTLRHNSDVSCQIQAGEHRFVHRPSCISYRHGLVATNARLDEQLAAGVIVLDDPVSNELLERIRKGAESSPFIPHSCKEILVDQGLIDD
jgi:hypothetical protein